MPPVDQAANTPSVKGGHPQSPLRRRQLFWRTVTRFDRIKVLPFTALRNTVGVALPLGIGVLTGHTLGGLAITTGALNVSYSDSEDSYRGRARRMLLASMLFSIAVLVGGVSHGHPLLLSAITVVWALVAGLVVALGTAAGDLANLSIVTLVVYSAQDLTVGQAFSASLLALGGGLFQTALSLLLWPVRRYDPERRMLGQLYSEMSRMTVPVGDEAAAPAASSQISSAQQMLTSLDQDHRVESDRYRSLLNQAERIRLRLLTLLRLYHHLVHTEAAAHAQGTAVVADTLKRFVDVTGDVLYSVSQILIANQPFGRIRHDLDTIHDLSESMRQIERTGFSPFLIALVSDAQLQIDALGGQLRVVVDLAVNTTLSGKGAFEKREARKPRRLQVQNSLAILRANLTLRSAACRHAIRLAVCIALGEAIGHAIGFRRSYWLPMTLAIVLKPDFTGTFSRGVLRLAGTFFGLALATVIFHWFHPSVLAQAALVGVFTYVLRWVGPANYGIFVVSISALIVVLVGMTGIPPFQLISARAENTAAGGVLALVAYLLWPTWERTQVREQFARLLDAYRAYFRAICDAYLAQAATEDRAKFDTLRLNARLARSNAEASVDRVSAEPGIRVAAVSHYALMLASSHRLIFAIMALDVGVSNSASTPARDAFRKYAADVDLTLYLLSAALRNPDYVKHEFPDLRLGHRNLAASGDPKLGRYALVNVETDRLTNSLNTLREQVEQLHS